MQNNELKELKRRILTTKNNFDKLYKFQEELKSYKEKTRGILNNSTLKNIDVSLINCTIQYINNLSLDIEKLSSEIKHNRISDDNFISKLSEKYTSEKVLYNINLINNEISKK